MARTPERVLLSGTTFHFFRVPVVRDYYPRAGPAVGGYELTLEVMADEWSRDTESDAFDCWIGSVSAVFELSENDIHPN